MTRLPDAFLQGVGYTPREIETLRDLYTQGIRFYSCFLSHGEPDAEFASRLRDDLSEAGISTWHYRSDLQPGKLMQPQIREQTRTKDKLLLICSQDALTRQPVIDEIQEAIGRGDEAGEQKLFPIRLDDYILSNGLTEYHQAQVDKGERQPWLNRVRAFWIADFRGWRTRDAYQREFDKLLEALRRPGPANPGSAGNSR